MSYQQYNETKRFILVTEQFEIISELLETDLPSKARMAIILIDNLAESLMFNACNLILDDNSIRGYFDPNSYDEKTKNKILKNFAPKIELLRNDSKRYFRKAPITAFIESAFLVGHFYRNAAYHRDTHNPSTIKLIGTVYFNAIVDFFVNIQQSVTVWTTMDIQDNAVLIKYNLPKNQIDHINYAQVIGKQVLTKHKLKFENLKKGLIDDLAFRFQELEGLDIGNQSIDQALIANDFQEFTRSNQELNDFESKIKIARSKAVQGSQKNKKYFEDMEIWQERYNKRYIELRSGWNSIIPDTYKEVMKLAQELQSANEVIELLNSYLDIDRKLTYIEKLLIQAAIDWDRFVQLQTDIARGK